MAPAPLRLKVCPSCRVAIPEEAATCPECGARQEVGAVAPTSAPRRDRAEEPRTHGPTGAPFDPSKAGPGQAGYGPEGANPFEEIFGQGASPRGGFMAPVAQAMVRRNLGCLVTLLLLVFGPPLLLGLLAGDTLKGLAWALLGVGTLGLLLTGWLIKLVRGVPRR